MTSRYVPVWNFLIRVIVRAILHVSTNKIDIFFPSEQRTLVQDQHPFTGLRNKMASEEHTEKSKGAKKRKEETKQGNKETSEQGPSRSVQNRMKNLYSLVGGVPPRGWIISLFLCCLCIVLSVIAQYPGKKWISITPEPKSRVAWVLQVSAIAAAVCLLTACLLPCQQFACLCVCVSVCQFV